MPKKGDIYDKLAVRLVDVDGPVRDSIISNNDGELIYSLARELREHFLSDETKHSLYVLGRMLRDTNCLHILDRKPKESCTKFRKRVLCEENSLCAVCMRQEALAHLKKLLGK